MWLVATCENAAQLLSDKRVPVHWTDQECEEVETEWWLDTSATALAMPLMRDNTPNAARPMATPSPVCVLTDNVASAPCAQTCHMVPTPLQLAAHAIAIIYNGLMINKMWDASFARGPDLNSGERRLATTHLGQPSTDGWNVVVGALELARIWALRRSTTVVAVGNDPYRLDRDTRLRTAVCLSVSWKFQRSMMTRFRKRFAGNWSALDHCYEDDHTCELAHLGYGFLFTNEQASFGGWSEENTAEIKRLCEIMLKLEVELLREVAVFALLTENAQVGAEQCLEQLYVEGVLTADRSMAVRSVVPFFVRAAVTGRPEDQILYDDLMNEHDLDVAAGALVCASFYCVASTCGATKTWSFSPAELELALRLLEAALAKKDAVFLRLGCYGNAEWLGGQYVCEESLRLARTALRCAGAYF